MPCNPDPHMPPPAWCNCKFSAAALHGKTVQFKVRVENGIEAGKGKLIVESGSKGYVRAAVQVVRDTHSTLEELSRTGMMTLTRTMEWISLSQAAIDAITQNPPGSECDFNMFAA